MTNLEQAFERYRRGDVAALGTVFDALAPELLLVAAHLAGGDVAEDLVQATFLDAIRQQHRWDERRPLVPWLIGILGNHVSESRRQRRRVPDPQRFEPQVSEGPDAAAEAAELVAVVRAAVEQLPQPYRRVLLLRLVHRLDLQQIATSLGVPLGTVKTQLHRGTAMLRRALPPSLATAFAVLLTPGRGLAAVREIVLGEAACTAVATAAVVASGTVLSVWIMKKTVPAVALVFAVAGGWLAYELTPPAVTPAPEPTRRAESVRVDDSAAPDSSAGVTVVGGENREAHAVRTSVPTTGTVEVEVVWDSDHQPVVAARIRLMRAGWKAAMNATTDASGHVVWNDVPLGRCAVSAHRGAEPVPVMVDAGRPARQRLSLTDELRLQCHVVDSAGHPVPDAAIWCNGAVRGEAPVQQLGTTNAAGVLSFRGYDVPAVWARKAGLQPSRTVTTDAKGDCVVRLVLGPAGCQLTGIVLDPDGLPVPAALVAVAQDLSLVRTGDKRPSAAVHTTADERGCFSFDELVAGDRPILAVAAGFAAGQARVRTELVTPARVTMRLRRGAVVTGRVMDGEQKPLPGATVQAHGGAWLLGFWGIEQLFVTGSAVADGEGRYRLAPLQPGEVKLTYFVSDFVSTTRECTLGDGEIADLDVTLSAGSAIAGRVVDADDRPLVSWHLWLTGSSGVQGVQLVERFTVTDGAGNFRIAGVSETGAYRITVHDPEARGAAARVARAESGVVRAGATDVLLRVASRRTDDGWITGRVVWPAGERGKATIALVTNPLPRGAYMVPREDLAAGIETFRIGPLPPGRYDVACQVDGRGMQSLTDLQLDAGRTLDVVFRLDGQRELRLRLRHADGRPVVGAVVMLEGSEGRLACTEHSPGEYRSPPTAPGRCVLSARGADFAVVHTDVDLGTDPDSVVQHTVQAGRTVALRFSWPSNGLLRVRLQDARGTELVSHGLNKDKAGAASMEIGLLPGRYTVTADTIPRATSGSLEFVVPEGDGVHPIDVPLR